MLLETVTAIPVLDPGDACPVVPAACILKSDVASSAISAVNPFQAFWDNFFVASPSDSLKSALELIWSVPAPNFDAAWFREAYTNQLAFYGIGISVLTLVIFVAWNLRPSGHLQDVVNSFIDWFQTLAMMAFAPVFSGLIALGSVKFGKKLFGLVDIDSPMDFLKFVDGSFFTVGWMSLAARATGTFLMVEVVVLFFVQILATLSASFVIPFRVYGAAGQEWFVKVVRGMLYGLAPLIMTGVIVLCLLIMQHVAHFGSKSLYQFVGVLLSLWLAAWLPLKLSKSSRKIVTKVALNFAESRTPPLRVLENDSPAYQAHERRLEQKRQRRQEVKNKVMDVAAVAAAAYTGGASAAMMAGMNAKSSGGSSTMRKFNRMKSYTDQAKKLTSKGKQS